MLTCKQNLTVSLDSATIQKAKVVAAKRATSISGLVAAQIEALINEDERYERAANSAIARMERGLHLGGGRVVSRDELHAR
jgi:hypothetical protein